MVSGLPRSNSGGVTQGMPAAKLYRKSIRQRAAGEIRETKTGIPGALRKFVRRISHFRHLLAEGVIHHKSATLQNDAEARGTHGPGNCAVKFLAGKVDTDSRRTRLGFRPCPSDYWISSLNLDADSGDMRVRWDVPVRIEREDHSSRLSNLNSIDVRSSAP